MPELVITELTTDAQLLSAYPLLSFLRDRLTPDTFVAEIRLQEDDGYRLFGASVGGQIVTLAGLRPGHTLARGKHIFIDDLATLPEHQAKGYATTLLRHLAGLALAEGWPRVYLDARNTALTYYEQLGFRTLPATPCWIETDRLAQAGRAAARPSAGQDVSPAANG